MTGSAPLPRLAGVAALAALAAAVALAAILIPDDPYWRGRTSARDVLYLVARFTLFALPICAGLTGLLWLAQERNGAGTAALTGLGCAAGAAVMVLLLLWSGETRLNPLHLLPGLAAGALAGWGIARAPDRQGD